MTPTHATAAFAEAGPWLLAALRTAIQHASVAEAKMVLAALRRAAIDGGDSGVAAAADQIARGLRDGDDRVIRRAWSTLQAEIEQLRHLRVARN